MHVSTPKTYAEERNVGVKPQGDVEWYDTGYTSISQYIAVYTSKTDAWAAHWFFHF